MLLILMAIAGEELVLKGLQARLNKLTFFFIFCLFFESHNLEAISQERVGDTASANAENQACFAPGSPGSSWPRAHSLTRWLSLSSQARHTQSPP